jgi:hypothetical protein
MTTLPPVMPQYVNDVFGQATESRCVLRSVPLLTVLLSIACTFNVATDFFQQYCLLSAIRSLCSQLSQFDTATDVWHER